MGIKMKNSETGEEIEISEEEFMEAMQNGPVYINQVVQRADGSTASYNIYGKSPANDIDNSVNIFTEEETLKAFVSRAVERSKKQIDSRAEEDKDLFAYLIDNDPEEYFMIVDDVIIPQMFAFRKSKDRIKLDCYVRDEQKSMSSPFTSAEITLTDNKARLNIEDVDESPELLYILGFTEMRNFLRESGDLKTLNELGNKGSGVIIVADGDCSDATAIIVTGHERPDLPCMLFGGLFAESMDDAVMMRPYIDELIVGDSDNELSDEEN